MGDPKLRYYADAHDEEDHEAILRLLRRVHDRHGVPVEIERIESEHGPITAFLGEIRRSTTDDAYDRDFYNNRRLSRNVGDPPSTAFQTNSGYRMIRGVVGVIDGGLAWATRYASSNNEPDPSRYSVDFLEAVAESGVGVIEDQYGERSGEHEEDVVDRFARSNTLAGDVDTEVVVGKSLIPDQLNEATYNMTRTVATRRVDLVARHSGRDWIVEAKKEWDAGSFDTALGQVQVSDHLYRLDNGLDEGETRKALLFGGFPSFPGTRPLTAYLVSIAAELGVEIFVETDDGFELVSESD